MKLNTDITINGKHYSKGDQIAWWKIYPFFLFHMGAFGLSGFYMAYFVHDIEPSFLYMHGGFAILVYLLFYFAIFGKEEVKWMFINAGLGIFGIYAEMSWILNGMGQSISSYPLHIHVIPFLYYVMYQFLLRQAFIDISGSRDDPQRKKKVERIYIIALVLLYAFLFFSR